MIEAAKTDTSIPLAVTVSKNGPATGLTAVVALRDGSSLTSYLDYADSTFKTSGWITRQAALTEIAGAGVYALSGGLDATAVTNFPAGVDTFLAEFDITGSTKAVAQEEVYFRDAMVVENADAVWDETRAAHVTVGSMGEFQANIDAKSSDIETDTADIQTRLPAALAGGRMDSDVGNMQAGTIDAAAIATDAVDADALAADAVSEIQSGLGTLAGQVSITVDIAAVQADTDDIQTRLPASLVSGRMDSDVGNMQTGTVNAAALATDAVDEIVDGTWDESVAAHVASGSFGELLDITKSLAGRTNTVIDGGPGTPDVVTNTTGFTTFARIRVFATSGAADAATKGAADGDDSEIFRGTWTGVPLATALHRLTSLTGRET